MDTKTCKKCGTAKPATREFFYTTKVTNKGRVYVCLRPECKQCSVAAAMQAKHCFADANHRLRRGMGGCRSSARWVEQTFGYSVGELAAHLERQFQRGMTWEAFFMGEIHIDHIVPVRLFDKQSPDEMRRCYGLPNLRPMWARDNLAKSGSVTHLI